MIITATTPDIPQVVGNLSHIEEKKDNPALPAEIFQQIFLECPLPAILMGMISCKNFKNILLENQSFARIFLSIPNNTTGNPDYAFYVLKLAKKVDGIANFQALSKCHLEIDHNYDGFDEKDRTIEVQVKETFIELFKPASSFCKHLKVLNLLKTHAYYSYDVAPDGLFHLTDLSFTSAFLPKWAAALGSFTSLRRLSVQISKRLYFPEDEQARATVLEGISQIRTLKELTLIGRRHGWKTFKLTKEEVTKIGKTTQITHLGLHNLEIKDFCSHLSSLTQLVALTTNALLKLDFPLPELQYLSVAHAFSILKPTCLPKLLIYSGNYVPNRLDDLTSLRYINLRYVYLSSSDLEVLNNCAQLRELNFEGTPNFTMNSEDGQFRLFNILKRYKIVDTYDSNYLSKFDIAQAK